MTNYFRELTSEKSIWKWIKTFKHNFPSTHKTWRKNTKNRQAKFICFERLLKLFKQFCKLMFLTQQAYRQNKLCKQALQLFSDFKSGFYWSAPRQPSMSPATNCGLQPPHRIGRWDAERRYGNGCSRKRKWAKLDRCGRQSNGCRSAVGKNNRLHKPIPRSLWPPSSGQCYYYRSASLVDGCTEWREVFKRLVSVIKLLWNRWRTNYHAPI